jgi:hypothetical protein
MSSRRNALRSYLLSLKPISGVHGPNIESIPPYSVFRKVEAWLREGDLVPSKAIFTSSWKRSKLNCKPVGAIRGPPPAQSPVTFLMGDWD